jgi:hypothetical protein
MAMLSIDFAPLFSWQILGALAAIGLLVLGFGAFRRARGLVWRTVSLAVIWLALANPVMVEENREARPDIFTVVVDESPSQDIGRRSAQTTAALDYLRAKFDAPEFAGGVELRVVRAGGAAKSGDRPVDGTRLFDALARTLENVPRNRIAGTLLITDGQVHDVPKTKDPEISTGPLHVLLTGKRNERDRRLTIENVPGFALVGKTAPLRIKITDTGTGRRSAQIRISKDGGPGRSFTVPVGRPVTVPIKIDHSGSNIIQIEVSPVDGELTAANNRGVVEINGVRERLRVLLVSGEPNPGERVWRNLLKADPSVDLVHFTILRPPGKQDATPVRELSLIAFPIRELFEIKLAEFDLIIFDRYTRRGVLPAIYLDNIAEYVKSGGAVLEASGPGFATGMSLYRTPLRKVLPGEPTGRVFERGLRPRLTVTGSRHPVTADLAGADVETPRWGRWFRQIEVTRQRGVSLMRGIGDRPLLILDRVGKGRVAQLLSDQVWLWARGYEGGGPHSELLRRLSHWLMKEPDLEENDLRAYVAGNELVVVRRSIKPDNNPVTVTSPSGRETVVTLVEGAGGRAKGSLPAREIGIYRISDGTRSSLAAVGRLNPLEFADMRATEKPLAGVARATGGGIRWIDDGMPRLRRVRAGRATSGPGWFGLVANRDYRVVSVAEAPFLPGFIVLLIGLGALMLAWWKEGR